MGVFGGIAGSTTIVGHRGVRLPGVAENTFAAFDAALQAGAEWVELDARRSKDGVVVVHHEAWLPGGTPVVERSAAELAGVGIITLEAALDHLAAGAGVNIEVKNLPGEPDYDPDDVIADLVAGVISQAASARRLLLSSFNPLTVGAMGRAAPDVPVGLVHYDGVALSEALPIALEFGAVALSSNVGAAGLDEIGIAEAHAAGLDVMVWTVNDIAEAARLVAAGVEALCTDDPATIVAGLGVRRPV